MNKFIIIATFIITSLASVAGNSPQNRIITFPESNTLKVQIPSWFNIDDYKLQLGKLWDEHLNEDLQKLTTYEDGSVLLYLSDLKSLYYSSQFEYYYAIIYNPTQDKVFVGFIQPTDSNGSYLSIQNIIDNNQFPYKMIWGVDITHTGETFPVVFDVQYNPNKKTDHLPKGSFNVLGASWLDLGAVMQCNLERTFNPSGSGTLVITSLFNYYAPQQSGVARRGGGRGITKITRMTGGYYFNIEGKFTQNFKWYCNDSILTINYLPGTTSTTKASLDMNEIGKNWYAEDNDAATTQYRRQIIAQFKADLPINSDVKEWKKKIIDIQKNKFPRKGEYEYKLVGFSNNDAIFFNFDATNRYDYTNYIVWQKGTPQNWVQSLDNIYRYHINSRNEFIEKKEKRKKLIADEKESIYKLLNFLVSESYGMVGFLSRPPKTCISHSYEESEDWCKKYRTRHYNKQQVANYLAPLCPMTSYSVDSIYTQDEYLYFDITFSKYGEKIPKQKERDIETYKINISKKLQYPIDLESFSMRNAIRIKGDFDKLKELKDICQLKEASILYATDIKDVINEYNTHNKQHKKQYKRINSKDIKALCNSISSLITVQDSCLAFISVRKEIAKRNSEIVSASTPFKDIAKSYATYFKATDLTWAPEVSTDKLNNVIAIQDECCEFIKTRKTIADKEATIIALGAKCKNILNAYKKYIKTTDLTWVPGVSTDKLLSVIDTQDKIIAILQSPNATEKDKTAKKLKDKSITSIINATK